MAKKASARAADMWAPRMLTQVMNRSTTRLTIAFFCACLSSLALPSEIIARGGVTDDVAQTWRVNEVYLVEVDGTFYEARYAGWRVIEGEGMYYFENGRVVRPVDDVGSDQLGRPHKPETSAAAQAAAGAAGIASLYRIAIVPPSLERDIKVAERELKAAEAEVARAEKEFLVRVESAQANGQAWARDLANRLGRTSPPMVIFTSVNPLGPQGGMHFRTTNAADLADLNSISTTISNARILSSFNAEAKEIGTAALAIADDASAAGDRAGFSTAIAIARSMADVLIGLDPFTGLARDTIEYFSGTNQITGEVLTDNQRTIRLVGMAAGILSFGVGSSFIRVTEKIAAITTKLRRLRPPPQLLLENASRLIRTGRGEFEVTDHALRRIGDRELTKGQVRAAINRGERYWDRLNSTTSFVAREGFISGKSLQVAVDLETKKVVTVLAKDFNPTSLLKDGRSRWVPFPEK
jgi:hypothetical protein